MAFSTNFRSWRTVAMATLLTGSMGNPEANADISAESQPTVKGKVKFENRSDSWIKIKRKAGS